MNRKKLLHIVLIAVSAIVVLSVCGLILWEKHFNPHRGTVDNLEYSLPLEDELTVDQARRDLSYAYASLADRHPMWLEDDASRVEQVKDLYVDALADLSLDEDGVVTVMDVWRAVSKMTAVLGDGHTYSWWQNPNQRFIDNLIMYGNGGKPLAVNGIPIEDVIESFRMYSSYETEAAFINSVYNSKIIREHYLNLIGIETGTGTHFTCLRDNGTLYDCWYNFVTADRVLQPQEPADTDTSWVSYKIDQAADLAVFTLKSCDFNDEYRQTLKAFFTEVAAAGISNVAVDLRGNGGGQSAVADEFIHYLPADSYESWWGDIRYGPFLAKFHNAHHKNRHADPLFNGTVYVLTDVDTYSSAMDFAMLIKDNGLGFIVGEASGNQPESYGDCLYFQLPESKLALSVSFKKWYRIDQTKAGQLIEPDFPCEPEMAPEEVKKIILERSAL